MTKPVLHEEYSRPGAGADAALQLAWPPAGPAGPPPYHMPAPSAAPQLPFSDHSRCLPAPAVRSQLCSTCKFDWPSIEQSCGTHFAVPTAHWLCINYHSTLVSFFRPLFLLSCCYCMSLSPTKRSALKSTASAWITHKQKVWPAHHPHVNKADSMQLQSGVVAACLVVAALVLTCTLLTSCILVARLPWQWAGLVTLNMAQ